MNLKRDLYFILERPSSHKYGTWIQGIIYINILISIFVLFLETEKSLSEYFHIFELINIVNITIFTIEYFARVYAINYSKRSRIKYMFTPFMIIDLLVILPFYLSFLNVDLAFLRALRILRIFKLFRLAKFVEFDNILASIIKEKKEEFIFILFASTIILFTITPLVYHFEHKVQPDVFVSMFDTLWWAIITFTTVGYGDMYPISNEGRVLTTIISILGIAFYAIPGSIFTTSLLHKIDLKKHQKHSLHQNTEHESKGL